MVDISGMPPPPNRYPDPKLCKDFADWLFQLTNKHGTCRVPQVDVARAAGKSKQAVTKWLNGGSIQAENLANLAEWTGAGYANLRRLVDESKLKTRSVESLEPRNGHALVSVESEITTLYRALTPPHRTQLLKFGRALLTTQPKRKK